MNSLGFNKDPSKTTVVVAMSGGVDSSVTAGLLKEQGYNVIGITLQLYESKDSAKKGSCCSGLDIYDARRVAQKLDIPHYVFNYEKNFKKDVIDYFVNSYANGDTPIPCIKCNETVKFRDLMDFAKKLEADCMATGHYVKREGAVDKALMYRANDKTKDQSYFLFATTQEQLDFLRFPLGSLNKNETRDFAKKLGLNVHDKKDSQDICFIPNGDYKSFIKLNAKEGNVIDKSGKILGKHEGIHNFTIGQRRGMGIASEKPLYVVDILKDTNEIIVGDKEHLLGQSLILDELNFITPDIDITAPTLKIKCTAKIRSLSTPSQGTLYKKENIFSFIFDNPTESITRGQACVLYDNERVLGGGIIKQKLN